MECRADELCLLCMRKTGRAECLCMQKTGRAECRVCGRLVRESIRRLWERCGIAGNWGAKDW